MKNQNLNIGFDECMSFLESYLEGIMTSGLLKPLQKFSQENSAAVGYFAKSWYDLQLEGLSPQKSLMEAVPSLPVEVSGILALGFEKSTLDMVLLDLLRVLRGNHEKTGLKNEFLRLEEKYKKINTSVICDGCVQSDLSKILARAQLEDARSILLEQQEDFLRQSYVGVKLVVVTEASIPEVLSSIKRTLGGSEKIVLDQGFFQIRTKSDREYFLENEDSQFQILCS